MEGILVGKSREQIYEFIHLRYRDDDCSNIAMTIYASEKMDEFLLHINASCEHQCAREGHSFFKFTTYDELLKFIYTDEDTIPFTWKKDFESKMKYEKEFFDEGCVF